MLGAIRRVISGEDVRGGDDNNSDGQQQRQQPSSGDQRPPQFQTNAPPSPMDVDRSPDSPPSAVLVEPDHEHGEYCENDAPLEIVQRDRNASDTFTANSSLSDASEAGKDHEQVDVLMEDVLVDEESPTPLAGAGSGHQIHQHPPAQYQQRLQSSTTNHRLQRMDSGASDGSDSGSARATTSQNSSRDWGWFEDVHVSGQLTPTSSMTRNHTNKDGTGKDKSHSKSKNKRSHNNHRMVVGLDPKDETAAAAMAVTAPTYVLEESLSSQRLWKDTAGNRPPQPVEERAFYEKMWAQNFARSQVNYQIPVEVLTATSPIALSPFAEGGTMEVSAAAAAAAGDGGNYQQYNMNSNTPANTHNMMVMPSSRGASQDDRGNDSDDYIRSGGLKEEPRQEPPTMLPPLKHQHIVNKTAKTESGEDLNVLVRGDNVFGTTVSKSFACSDGKGGPITGVDTVNISIASYRVVESHKNGKYAQFLVIYREGSIRDTIGVWKRYSDFDDLAKEVTQAHEGCASVIANMSPLAITEEPDVEHLPNAITSWRLLKKRQRWYRCLDAGYLSLKVFLLERFLHDILFESSSPKLLREFVGADESLSH